MKPCTICKHDFPEEDIRRVDDNDVCVYCVDRRDDIVDYDDLEDVEAFAL